MRAVLRHVQALTPPAAARQGSSVRGTVQAGILEQVAFSSSKGSSVYYKPIEDIAATFLWEISSHCICQDVVSDLLVSNGLEIILKVNAISFLSHITYSPI